MRAGAPGRFKPATAERAPRGPLVLREPGFKYATAEVKQDDRPIIYTSHALPTSVPRCIGKPPARGITRGAGAEGGELYGNRRAIVVEATGRQNCFIGKN